MEKTRFEEVVIRTYQKLAIRDMKVLRKKLTSDLAEKMNVIPDFGQVIIDCVLDPEKIEENRKSILEIQKGFEQAYNVRIKKRIEEIESIVYGPRKVGFENLGFFVRKLPEVGKVGNNLSSLPGLFLRAVVTDGETREETIKEMREMDKKLQAFEKVASEFPLFKKEDQKKTVEDIVLEEVGRWDQFDKKSNELQSKKEPRVYCLSIGWAKDMLDLIVSSGEERAKEIWYTDYRDQQMDLFPNICPCHDDVENQCSGLIYTDLSGCLQFAAHGCIVSNKGIITAAHVFEDDNSGRRASYVVVTRKTLKQKYDTLEDLKKVGETQVYKISTVHFKNSFSTIHVDYENENIDEVLSAVKNDICFAEFEEVRIDFDWNNVCIPYICEDGEKIKQHGFFGRIKRRKEEFGSFFNCFRVFPALLISLLRSASLWTNRYPEMEKALCMIFYISGSSFDESAEADAQALLDYFHRFLCLTYEEIEERKTEKIFINYLKPTYNELYSKLFEDKVIKLCLSSTPSETGMLMKEIKVDKDKKNGASEREDAESFMWAERIKNSDMNEIYKKCKKYQEKLNHLLTADLSFYDALLHSIKEKSRISVEEEEGEEETDEEEEDGELDSSIFSKIEGRKKRGFKHPFKAFEILYVPIAKGCSGGRIIPFLENCEGKCSHSLWGVVSYESQRNLVNKVCSMKNPDNLRLYRKFVLENGLKEGLERELLLAEGATGPVLFVSQMQEFAKRLKRKIELVNLLEERMENYVIEEFGSVQI